MRTLLAILALAAVAAPAGAQQANPHAAHQEEQAPPDPHAGGGPDAQPAARRGAHAEGHEPPAPPPGKPPAAALSGPRHAADLLFDPAVMASARRQLRAEHGGMPVYEVTVGRLEMPVGDGGNDYAWEAQLRYGGDTDSLRVKSRGEGSFGAAAEEAELQALWSHAFTPWFDVQAGVRYDWHPEPGRGYLVLGLQGLMPYLFEIDAAAFLSGEGDLSARIETGYDLRVTQRLVLRPRAEIEFAFADVPELRVGSGTSRIEAGLRLRYELAPELAPYAGVQWERRLGETADFARRAGASTNDLFLVAGASFWF